MVELVPDLPEFVPASPIENTQGISTNLNELKAKFIDPIDSMRSEYMHGQSTGDPQESRANTYYRMLGFPVVFASGEFYNPGFNPPIQVPADLPPEALVNIPPDVLQKQNLRESEIQKNKSIFRYAGLDSTMYALALGVADGMQNFYKDTPDESFTEPTRRSVLAPMYATPSGAPITRFYEAGYHIIFPITVNPAVIVKPGNRHVCQPFLTEKNRIYEGKGSHDVKLKRPGIEIILRYRLRDNSNSTAYKDAVAALVSQEPSATNPLTVAGLNRADLVQVVSALIEEGSINEASVIEELSNITSYELLNINGFVKTVKALIKILAKSFKTIDDVTKQISWTPLPEDKGPEFGCRQGSFVKRTIGRSELERRQALLKVKASENIPDAGAKVDVQDFAVATWIHNSAKKSYTKPIQETADDINEESDRGAKALRNIELIVGEISGFGLINIMATLIAMWSVSEDVLISLLDNAAFDRLYANEALRTSAVQERKDNGAPKFPINDAIGQVEKKINNVLDFADRLFDQARGVPSEGEGGEPARS